MNKFMPLIHGWASFHGRGSWEKGESASLLALCAPSPWDVFGQVRKQQEGPH